MNKKMKKAIISMTPVMVKYNVCLFLRCSSLDSF